MPNRRLSFTHSSRPRPSTPLGRPALFISSPKVEDAYLRFEVDPGAAITVFQTERRSTRLSRSCSDLRHSFERDATIALRWADLSPTSTASLVIESPTLPPSPPRPRFSGDLSSCSPASPSPTQVAARPPSTQPLRAVRSRHQLRKTASSACFRLKAVAEEPESLGIGTGGGGNSARQRMRDERRRREKQPVMEAWRSLI